MSIAITQTTLENAYELLAWTEPFLSMHLPGYEDVTFKISKSNDLRGRYWRTQGGGHVIEISAKCNQTLDALLRTMAHEMAHLAEGAVYKDRRDVMHSKTWRAIADDICRVHGWDRALF